jgi:signal peptidase II
MEQKNTKFALIAPALLTVVIIIADQATKAWIAGNIPMDTIGSRHMGDFLWIVHTRNLGIAFSIGDSLARIFRIALFIVLPACFLAAATVFSIVSRKLTLIQRYAIAFIVAGGVGNLIDRIFRPEGVVDFISLSLFGILGLDRFPTFNIADSAVTVGAVILLISGFLIQEEGAVNDKRS